MLPTPPRQRFLLPDVLRGVALGLIVGVNALLILQPAALGPGAEWRGTDALALAFVRFAMEGKGYALFALLFGLGVALQARRGALEDASGRRVYRRRIAALAVLGALHGVFLWSADILLPYALLGLLLPALAVERPGRLVAVAAVLLAVPVAVSLGAAAVAWVNPASAESLRPQLADLPSPTAGATFATGSWIDVTLLRAREAAGYYTAMVGYGWTVFALMVLGLAAGRAGWFNAGAMPWRQVVGIGIGIGVPLNGAYVVLVGSGGTAALFLAQAVQPFAVASLAAGYAGLLAAALVHGGRLWSWLAAAGRMPLTHYVAQSAVLTTVSYGYGLGQYGAWGPTAILAGAFALFILQVTASRAWLRRFRYGPLEGLWRWAAYGRRPVFRLNDSASASAAPGA